MTERKRKSLVYPRRMIPSHETLLKYQKKLEISEIPEFFILHKCYMYEERTHNFLRDPEINQHNTQINSAKLKGVSFTRICFYMAHCRKIS